MEPVPESHKITDFGNTNKAETSIYRYNAETTSNNSQTASRPGTREQDMEKGSSLLQQGPGSGYSSALQPPHHDALSASSTNAIVHKALRWGRIEQRGIEPLHASERTSTQYFHVFTIWFSINFSILGVTFGMLGPQVYLLSLRDSSLVIIFFTLLTTIAPAFLSTLGPRTGMRQMIQARYSFGRYLVGVPVLLNLATLTGYIVIICVVGGQCLSAVSEKLTPDAGIIIIGLLGLLISFSGFKLLHIYETWAWFPALVAILVVLGCGGKGLKYQAAPTSAATASAVLDFGMIVASYMIPWAAIASDLSTYFSPKVSPWRIFVYTYAGLAIPTILLLILGAAIAGAIPNNPSWQAGNDTHQLGGVLAAMLSPAGGFGKFILVLLSLSLLANTAGTMYAITLNFQTLIPWLFKIPRYFFAIVVTAIVIPVSIKASTDFFNNLENFVGLIGYWSASFVGIVIMEHVAFKKRRHRNYDRTIWNDGHRLPLGVAALLSMVLSFGLVVPFMAQVWWTGPAAKTTGDIGFEVAFVMSALFYLLLRWAEIKIFSK